MAWDTGPGVRLRILTRVGLTVNTLDPQYHPIPWLYSSGEG